MPAALRPLATFIGRWLFRTGWCCSLAALALARLGIAIEQAGLTLQRAAEAPRSSDDPGGTTMRGG
jgi:hypothetical protein